MDSVPIVGHLSKEKSDTMLRPESLTSKQERNPAFNPYIRAAKPDLQDLVMEVLERDERERDNFCVPAIDRTVDGYKVLTAKAGSTPCAVCQKEIYLGEPFVNVAVDEQSLAKASSLWGEASAQMLFQNLRSVDEMAHYSCP